MKLLSVSQDAKTVKGEKLGYLTGILYLAPSDESGVINTCPAASKGCRKVCIFHQGRGGMPSVIEARVRKTREFAENRESFVAQLAEDISELIRKAEKENLIPVVRLNGTSDIAWEKEPIASFPNLMAKFPTIQFYDYTKIYGRAIAFATDSNWPSNYQLTFSRSESNGAKVEKVIEAGVNVSVVFATDQYPHAYLSRKVVDGDGSDLRFLDRKIAGVSEKTAVIVGLKAKGTGKKDTTGFVVHAS